MHQFLRNNGLSLALVLLFIASALAQLLLGLDVWNEERRQHALAPLSVGQYVHSGHFRAATFENWESEFLQMGIYVLLTVWLRQRGSAESRPMSDEGTKPTAEGPAPWPVRRGGLWRTLYAHSLSIALFALFLGSFLMHLAGSWRLAVDEALLEHRPPVELLHHLASARFWFESMQNWQSEFLSVLALVILSIWLRQDNSPQSKALTAPHDQTGT